MIPDICQSVMPVGAPYQNVTETPPAKTAPGTIGRFLLVLFVRGWSAPNKGYL